MFLYGSKDKDTNVYTTESFQEQADKYYKKIGSLTVKHLTLNEKPRKMLNNIYKSIDDMKLKYEDGEFIVPTMKQN